MVMTTHAKGRGQRSLCAKVGVEINGQRTNATSLPPVLTQLVTSWAYLSDLTCD